MKDKVDFERNNPIFWFLWDYSLGLLLAFWIFIKSMYKIWKDVSISKTIKILRYPKKRKKHIRKGRENLKDMRTMFFNRNSRLLQHFCQNVTNASALDDVYNSNRNFHWSSGKSIIPLSAKIDSVARFYLNCPNGQAVRNRYKGVGVQFEKAVKELLSKKDKISILSIACGSAQSLICRISQMVANGFDSHRFELILTDISEESLVLAKNRAIQGGISSSVRFVKSSFQDIPVILNEHKYDIIEACGILDYLPDVYVIMLLKLAYSLLNKGGFLITSNMNKTRGARILTWTYNWEIIYRTSEELLKHLQKTDFQNIKIFTEPWNIHLYVVVKKIFNDC